MFFIYKNAVLEFNLQNGVFIRLPVTIINERAGVRTRDNLIKSQVLYQLSYTPAT